MIDHECLNCGSMFSISFEFEEDELSFCPSCGEKIEDPRDEEDEDEWGI